jgi:hypothetical protein
MVDVEKNKERVKIMREMMLNRNSIASYIQEWELNEKQLS